MQDSNQSNSSPPTTKLWVDKLTGGIYRVGTTVIVRWSMQPNCEGFPSEIMRFQIPSGMHYIFSRKEPATRLWASLYDVNGLQLTGEVAVIAMSPSGVQRCELFRSNAEQLNGYVEIEGFRCLRKFHDLNIDDTIRLSSGDSIKVELNSPVGFNHHKSRMELEAIVGVFAQ